MEATAQNYYSVPERVRSEKTSRDIKGRATWD